MNLANYTTPELFKLHQKVLAELRRREHASRTKGVDLH
jgi:hypothetical protein